MVARCRAFVPALACKWNAFPTWGVVNCYVTPNAMSGAFPSCNQEDRAATESIGQKKGSHCPILLVDDGISHRRRVRGKEQSPRAKRNGFRTTLVFDGPGDLRDVSQKAQAVE